MYRIAKRVLDFSISLIALVLLSPLLAWIAWKIKEDSNGPVIFKQTRLGQNQREFAFYKFRTMVENAEQLFPKVKHLNEVDGPVFKIANDPRLTPFGKWLRSKNLDELPQLWNVLRGEMSLVGFRPPIPSEVKYYKKWHMQRFNGKPGITSLWAVKGGHSLSFDEWIKMDLWYNENASLLFDLKVLWITVSDVTKRLATKNNVQNHYANSSIVAAESGPYSSSSSQHRIVTAPSTELQKKYKKE